MAKMISCWGSPGVGKTTFSVALGTELASKKYDTLLLTTDLTVPTIPVILPQASSAIDSSKDKIRSIGKLLTSVDISSNDILEQCVSVPNYTHLALLGYAYGENQNTYPDPVSYDIYNLFAKLSDIVDYIIVDCSSDIRDMLSIMALENSDYIFRACGCSCKDLSYFASNLSLVPQNNIKHDDHILIMPDVKSDDALGDVKDFYDNIQYVFKHDPTLKKMDSYGELFLSQYPSSYKKGIKELIKEVGILE